MAPSGFVVAYAVLTTLTFVTSSALIIYSWSKKYWLEKDTPNTVRCTLRGCILSYWICTLCTFLFYLFSATLAANMNPPPLDPREHPAVSAAFYLFVTSYVVAMMLNLYVWIQRLEHIFTGSAYGYSAKLLKVLKYVFVAILVFLVLLSVTLTLNFELGNNRAVYVASRICIALYALLFDGESLVVSSLFVSKLRTLLSSLTKQMEHEQETKTFALKLLYVSEKMSILVWVQVLTSLLGLLSFPALAGETIMSTMALDAFVSFVAIYCALVSHDHIFRVVCFPCLQCCFYCCNVQRVDAKLTANAATPEMGQGRTSQLASTTKKSKSGTGTGSGSGQKDEETTQTQTQI